MRHRQLEPLVHEDADSISRTHALVDQNIGELVRLTDKLLVSQAGAFETVGLVRGIALSGVVDRVMQEEPHRRVPYNPSSRAITLRWMSEVPA